MTPINRNRFKKTAKRVKCKRSLPRPSKDKRFSTPWDQAAAWYDALVGDQGSDYQQEVIMPGAWRLLEMEKGSSVLDLACGQGVFSRFMNERGVQVEGLDVSKGLIRYASDRSPKKINY